MRARPQAISAIAAAVLGLVFGWVCTSPSYSMGVNWDTSGYAADIGNASPWSRIPWNSHYGVGHVYWLMMHLMAFLGQPALDGIRVANALALAWSAAALTFGARALGLRPAMRLAVAGLYLSAWGTILLAATWEDNILVQPAALSALAICLGRLNAWRARDGIWAGVLVGLSSLMSWQGAAYLVPVVYAALLADRGRTWSARLRHALAVPLAFTGMRALWTVGFWWSTDKLPLAVLFQTAFERPSPNFLPSTLDGWLAMLSHPRDVLIHAGIGVTHELGPSVRDLPGIEAYLVPLGGALIGLALALWLVLALLLRKRVNAPVRFLSVAFLLLTAATVVYLDVPADKYKRYDYLPIFASLGFPVLLLGIERWFTHRSVRAGIRHASLVAAVLLILAQGWAGYTWNRQWYGKLWDGYAGRNGQTWMASLRAIHEQAPQACAYLFAYAEVANGRYQLEIPAALSNELGRALVLGSPFEVTFWPRSLPMADTGFVKAHLRGCEWISPQAQALLSAR